MGAQGAELAGHDAGDVFEVVEFGEGGPDFVGAELEGGPAEAAQGGAEEGQGGLMVGVPVARVGQIDEGGALGLEDGQEEASAGLDVVADGPVGQAEEIEAGDAQQAGSGFGLGLADFPGLLRGQVFQAEFAGSEEDDGDTVSAGGVEAKGAAAADDFIVRVRSNDENVHARLLRAITCSKTRR